MQRLVSVKGAQECECADVGGRKGLAQPARCRKQRTAARNHIVHECQPQPVCLGLADAPAWTDRYSTPWESLDRERSVVLEHRWTLACSREGGFLHRVSAPQQGPDLRRQTRLPQTPRHALSDPLRTLRRGAPRNGNQHHTTAKGWPEAPVTYRLQPYPRDESR